MRSSRRNIPFIQPLRGIVRGRHPSVPAPEISDPAAEIQAAYEKGRLDGETALGEQLVQQRAEVRQLVAGVIRSMEDAVTRVLRDTEEQLAALSLDIACKLVAGIPLTGEMVEAAVKESLAEVEGTSEIHVRLHPEDLELLGRMGSTLLQPSADARKVHFHAAPEVSRGGCLVQTRFGIIDARRETRLDQVKRSLLE